MPTKEYKATEATAIREEWVNAVRHLVDDVARWSTEKGWKTRLTEREINEAIGRYTVPELEVDIPESDGGIIVQPKARVVLGGAGRVDLSALPTLWRVLLMRDAAALERSGESRWLIVTESGLNLKAEWNKQTFYDIVAEWLSNV